jgi:hypothetical protein
MNSRPDISTPKTRRRKALRGLCGKILIPLVFCAALAFFWQDPQSPSFLTSYKSTDFLLSLLATYLLSALLGTWLMSDRKFKVERMQPVQTSSDWSGLEGIFQFLQLFEIFFWD